MCILSVSFDINFPYDDNNYYQIKKKHFSFAQWETAGRQMIFKCASFEHVAFNSSSRTVLLNSPRPSEYFANIFDQVAKLLSEVSVGYFNIHVDNNPGKQQ